MMDKTLYLADLDGTLLAPDQSLSPFTVQVINHLLDQGMIFTYATARSYHSAHPLTRALHLRCPVIVNNGAFILKNGTWERLHENYFTASEAAFILRLLHDRQVHPLVYTYLGNEQKYSYQPELLSRGALKFLISHPEDPRKRPANTAEMLDGQPFYFTCIDEYDKLRPCYELLKDTFRCDLQLDQYDGEYWLEIMPSRATKAHAALKLKEMLGCKRMVVFGDGVNDMPLFEIADACYAMANGQQSLKDIATAVIDSNKDDGVAQWLMAHWK